jgi:hypothetical protein
MLQLLEWIKPEVELPQQETQEDGLLSQQVLLKVKSQLLQQSQMHQSNKLKHQHHLLQVKLLLQIHQLMDQRKEINLLNNKQMQLKTQKIHTKKKLTPLKKFLRQQESKELKKDKAMLMLLLLKQNMLLKQKIKRTIFIKRETFKSMVV